jgi:predicted amidophosphoribosyltransferase
VERGGGLFAACLAVRLPGPEVCRVCCGALEGPHELCWSCREVRRRLGRGRQLNSLTPVSLTKRGNGLYAALRQYKGKPTSIAARQKRRLAELVGGFCERHLWCAAPDGADVVTVVPSLQVPTEIHPLLETLHMVPVLDGAVHEVLSVESAAMERNAPDPGAYRCDASLVAGKRVLLVDDVYTTGAHMHSAACTIEDAGARSVSLVALARYQDPGWPPAKRLLDWSASHRHWSAETCVRCSD